ncbi:MAG: DUF1761 domain-containing protein [Candidatus Microsaccharimonas sp.]
MIDFGALNYWAILVAWVFSIILGSFWYSPAGFGKLWTKLSGVDIMKLPQNEANKAIGAVIVSSLFQALALGIVLYWIDPANVWEGLVAGLVIWFGFITLTTVGTTLYQRRSFKFLWLNSSFFLIVLVVNSVILTLWR